MQNPKTLTRLFRNDAPLVNVTPRSPARPPPGGGGGSLAGNPALPPDRRRLKRTPYVFFLHGRFS
jgi:hypothetical protein